MTTAPWARLMDEALVLAQEGRYGASPNPLVGAIVLDRNGAIVGRGAHRYCGGPHAEIGAIETAGALAVGGTLVVTLEPCSHQGRTPPCVDAVLATGIKRVVIGTHDPNPLVNGRGVETLRAAGVEVIEGVGAEKCRALNRAFFHWIATGAPHVTLKMAMSIDGKLAARGGKSRWITSEESRREGYALREEHDALLVGSRTIALDDPRLVRHLKRNPNPHLMRVVLDSHLATREGAALFMQLPEDIVLFCLEDAPSDRRQAIEATGARVVQVGADERGRCDLRQVLRWLGSNQISSLLVEGGGEVHWSFLHEGLAQRLYAFVAPLVLGGREAVSVVGGLGYASPQEAARLRFEKIERIGDDLLVVAEVIGV